MGMILFAVLIVVLVRDLSPETKYHITQTSNNAVSILKERYARGEISREEYLKIIDSIR